MDTFRNNYAQQRYAQDMITANYMAEAEEKERMAAKLTGYENMLQEMQKCNLQNLENAEKVKELLSAALEKIEEIQKKEEPAAGKALEELKKLLEEQKAGEQNLAEVQAEQTKKIEELLEKQNEQRKEELDAFQKQVDERLQAMEEFTHKESVKVYRNVQAVLEENTAKQTKEIAENSGDQGISGGLVAVWILTLLAALGNIGFIVAQYLGLL